MPKADFEKYKLAVVDKKLEGHKNMWQESMAPWTQIHAGWLDFGQKKRKTKITRNLSKQDILNFFEGYFFDKPDERVRRISVHIESQRLLPNQWAQLLPLFGLVGIEVNPAQVAVFVASKPTVDVASAFAQGLLAQVDNSTEEMEPLLAAIRRLEDKSEAPKGVELIVDAN